jgi:hypothetical protein
LKKKKKKKKKFLDGRFCWVVFGQAFLRGGADAYAEERGKPSGGLFFIGCFLFLFSFFFF